MTNKLTADKARERIAHLTAWREQRGLTLREEEYLEAMEIAEHVLECKENRIAAYFSPVALARYLKGFNIENMNATSLAGYITGFVERDQ